MKSDCTDYFQSITGPNYAVSVARRSIQEGESDSLDQTLRYMIRLHIFHISSIHSPIYAIFICFDSNRLKWFKVPILIQSTFFDSNYQYLIEIICFESNDNVFIQDCKFESVLSILIQINLLDKNL